MELLERVRAWLAAPVAGNPIWAWAAALAAALAVLVLLLLLRRALARRLVKAEEVEGGGGFRLAVARLVSSLSSVVLLIPAAYAGLQFLRLPPRLEDAFRAGVIVLLLFQGGRWANALLNAWIRARLQGGQAAATTASLIVGFAGRLAVWALVLLLALENLGVNVTALVAGLGVGGIAVALAVQSVLSDFLGSVAIALDKPFELGDFIIVGDFLGTVEHIGLKTTRVRSLFGEQIVFANSDLLGGRIRNYKRMKERRIVFSIGVTYQTPPEKLEAIPRMLKEVVEKQPDLRFDRAHFQKYGDFALIFEIVYYVQLADYNVYMDRQQAINLDIFKAFAREGIEFAYPTQTLIVSGAIGRPEAT